MPTPPPADHDHHAAGRVHPDASELVLCTDERYACETYIFDPVSEEESLGRLFAVAETEERGGIGSELLDLTIQALQREYYRDPSRGILASFESALHQANLVLHDTAEQGVRDWMGYFHVAAGVLANDTLHLSTSGEASIFLVRRNRVTLISTDLSHSPITNPLRTFAQVASGTLLPRDILYFGTSHFTTLFRPEELARFAIDHSASTISTRLQQLYQDKGELFPLALLTISILPDHIVAPRREPDYFVGMPRRVPRSLSDNLTPRKPLVINRSALKTMLVFLLRMIVETGQRIKHLLWPLIVYGSKRGGRALATVSAKTGQNMRVVARQQLKRWRQPGAVATPAAASVVPAPPSRSFSLHFWPQRLPRGVTLKQLPQVLWQALRKAAHALPRSSKIFAVLTIVLALALVVSVVMLRQKRAEEAVIVRASEILHDARNSKNAAEDALIYDNREQARTLLAQTQTKIDELSAMGLYTEEVTALRTDLTTISDRLQKVVRSSTQSPHVVGDFNEQTEGRVPRHLQLVDENLFTFHPEKNTVWKMASDGTVSVAAERSEGVGFLATSTAHPADKQIVLGTDTPGIAVFDAKSNVLQNQTIEFPSGEAEIIAVATYGSRLYLYDKTASNIVSFNKTLRGYSGATPWITNADFPKDTIISIGVDGNIYTLHSDGAFRKLLKGEPVDFKPDSVDPPLAGATKLYKTEDLTNIYILDIPNKRVVIYDTKGKLVRQLFLDVTQQLSDIAISPDESTLYVLDGSRVLAIKLPTES